MTPTARQFLILDWLNRAHPHAGRMFESALWIAADERIPCRGRMIAHAYREICSMLMNEYSSNSREVLGDKLKKVVAEFVKLGISFDTTSGASPEPDSAPVSVPQSFLKAAAAVARVQTSTENARARARAIFEGISGRQGPRPDMGPTADRWFRMSAFFPKWAHDRTTPDAQMTEGQFKQEVEFFEQTLSSLAESAVSNLDALDDILEDTNS